MKNKEGNKIKEGLYEQVINKELKKQLEALNLGQYLIEKEVMDVEEARTILSSYTSNIIKKSLRYIRENNSKDGKEALLSQIKACNKLINGFVNLSKGYYIHLEKQAKEYIMRNIKAAKITRASLVSKMKYFEQDTQKNLPYLTS